MLPPARLLFFTGIAVGVFGVGYLTGAYRASNAASSIYFRDTVQRELTEARHDGAIVRLLNSGRADTALEVAQERYYTRVVLLSDLVGHSRSDNLRPMVSETITQATRIWQEHPYTLQNEKSNESWKLLRQ